MDNPAAIGYFLAAFFYAALSILLVTTWRGRQEGGMLLLATSVSAIWASVETYQAVSGYLTSLWSVVAELVRNVSWLGFFLLVLSRIRESGEGRSFLRTISIVVLLLGGSAALMLLLLVGGSDRLSFNIGFGSYVSVFLLLALIGLILVEQLFRNTAVSQRWAIKYLCLGMGGMFAFDFYLYSNAFLLSSLDEDIWAARGFVNIIIAPMLAISAARNPQWSIDVSVSRSFVFHTTTLLAAGGYLLAMAAGGYYINLVGGEWGGLLQLVFLFGMGMVLFVMLFSGQLRARLRVFLSKHFFSYRYDYREEWLRFITTLSKSHLDTNPKPMVIMAISQIVESPAGMLWQSDASGEMRPVVGWNMSDQVDFSPVDNRSLLTFWSNRAWVIDLSKFEAEKESYAGLELPTWLQELPSAWLLVPLLSGNNCTGFVVLAQPRTKILVNWEVRDLLLTTGRQSANYLALLDTNEALMDARQFEAFNRLSAYVVHDLKNIVAQLALVVTNAERHRDNPDFIDDAFATVKNATDKMNRMLAQLRKGHLDEGDSQRLDLHAMLMEVIHAQAEKKPLPTYMCKTNDMMVVANVDRLAAVMGHLIQNAQEATSDDGKVNITLHKEGALAIVQIQDTGCGMDAEFIRERLFRPFHTTKGNAGMGIGVYESREFIDSLGGRLEVKSEPGQGTTFSIYLHLDATNQYQKEKLRVTKDHAGSPSELIVK